MNNEYFNYLVEQFKQSTSVKNIDVNSQTFISEFYDWINNRGLLAVNYLNLIDYMNLDVYGDSIAEVGKGKYDSVVDVNYFDTIMITPFSDDMTVSNKKRIISSDFRVLGGLPMLVEIDKKNNTILRAISSKTISTYITQNPYTSFHIANWEQLHNSGEYDIIIGVYGNVYDKDKMDKINELKKFSLKLNDDFIVEYATVGDTYYYVTASKKNVKKLKKVLNK